MGRTGLVYIVNRDFEVVLGTTGIEYLSIIDFYPWGKKEGWTWGLCTFISKPLLNVQCSLGSDICAVLSLSTC